MGNGVSADQGNLPSYGKRNVREGFGAKRHDWSELARTREIVTSPPNRTSYTCIELTHSVKGFISSIKGNNLPVASPDKCTFCPSDVWIKLSCEMVFDISYKC